MLKVLVVFGSKSDASVYSKVLSELQEANINHDFRILSAHRTPGEIDKLMKKEDYCIIIAGAGLSAALPGVIASKTVRPVIGVPVDGNYGGLDALLSIMQMPPGIPVLSVGVNKADNAADEAENMLKVYELVNIIGKKGDEVVKKATDVLDKLNAPYKFSDKPDSNAVNIEFTLFDEPIEEKNELVIYCPMLLRKDDSAEAALNVLKHSTHGLWVGLNRGENAAIAAVEILNLHGRFEKELLELRQKGREMVLKDNNELKK